MVETVSETSVMMKYKKNWLHAALILIPCVYAGAESFDFSIDDQEFIATSGGTGAVESSFSYDNGRWVVIGAEAGTEKFVSATLTSPLVTVDGDVIVRIAHQFDFEMGFDGAHLLVSLNGGEALVAGEAIGTFVENGYSSSIQEQSSNPRRGAMAWSGRSDGRVTSVLDLGALPPGTTVQLGLEAIWDAGSLASLPNWEIFEVSIGNGEDARTWLVDNDETNASADFHNLSEALSSASVGDVVLVMPSVLGYGRVELEKRLTLVGPGFGGAELGARFRDQTARISSISVEPSVVGATVMGFEVEESLRFVGRRDSSPSSQILFLRNSLPGIGVSSTGSLKEVFFINNWIRGSIKLVEGNDFTESFHLQSGYFYNNVIRGGIDLFDSWTTSGATRRTVTTAANAVFANNIFTSPAADIVLNEGQFYNNLVHRGAVTDSESGIFSVRDSVVDGNVFFGAFPSDVDGDSNTFVNSATEIMRWSSGVWYEPFELLEDSIAQSAGRDGSEAGLFGGLYPWDRDQAPPIPFVTNLEAPTLIGQGESMTIRVQVKSNQ